jgi:thiazole synthase ThiGH ThiG subunit
LIWILSNIHTADCDSYDFIIGSRSFQSRLLVGTGKYKDLNETDLAIQASGAEGTYCAISIKTTCGIWQNCIFFWWNDRQ